MQIGCIHPNKGCVYFVYPPIRWEKAKWPVKSLFSMPV